MSSFKLIYIALYVWNQGHPFPNCGIEILIKWSIYSWRGSTNWPVQGTSASSLDADPDAYDEEAEAEETESTTQHPGSDPPHVVPAPAPEAPSATATPGSEEPAVMSSWLALEFSFFILQLICPFSVWDFITYIYVKGKPLNKNGPPAIQV